MKNMKINQLVVGVCQTNCYIIYNKDTNEAMIVDPGDQAEDISMRCRMLGVVPKAILLTHGHFDHMMAAGKLKEEFHIPIYAAEKEVPLLADARANLSAMWARPVCIKPDCLVKEGDELDICGFSITVIETPGHTIGGVCFYIPEEEVLLSGDTLFCGSFGRTDFPTGSMSVLARSIREKLFQLPDVTQVYPGHESSTTIGYEKRYNPLGGRF
ncbi:MAG TPA: MBL fold metallo-hydrolase [Candidatus Fimimorpha faecalis]|uniref:MBL fold metallo-hydrolase n=1 Tax=Candidatus Fimimorpha faecalis TaxID=2840824 RepID=A0A9D1JE06_9FIRM|nr:MBL fold metallo-hydrolase [Candidatus Fimimorpha faecalis]